MKRQYLFAVFILSFSTLMAYGNSAPTAKELASKQQSLMKVLREKGLPLVPSELSDEFTQFLIKGIDVISGQSLVYFEELQESCNDEDLKYFEQGFDLAFEGIDLCVEAIEAVGAQSSKKLKTELRKKLVLALDYAQKREITRKLWTFMFSTTSDTSSLRDLVALLSALQQFLELTEEDQAFYANLLQELQMSVGTQLRSAALNIQPKYQKRLVRLYELEKEIADFSPSPDCVTASVSANKKLEGKILEALSNIKSEL